MCGHGPGGGGDDTRKRGLGGEGKCVWPWVGWGWEKEGDWPDKGSVCPGQVGVVTMDGRGGPGGKGLLCGVGQVGARVYMSGEEASGQAVRRRGVVHGNGSGGDCDNELWLSAVCRVCLSKG